MWQVFQERLTAELYYFLSWSLLSEELSEPHTVLPLTLIVTMSSTLSQCSHTLKAVSCGATHTQLVSSTWPHIMAFAQTLPVAQFPLL